jgi:hypothetical protein
MDELEEILKREVRQFASRILSEPQRLLPDPLTSSSPQWIEKRELKGGQDHALEEPRG